MTLPPPPTTPASSSIWMVSPSRRRGPDPLSHGEREDSNQTCRTSAFSGRDSRALLLPVRLLGVIVLSVIVLSVIRAGWRLVVADQILAVPVPVLVIGLDGRRLAHAL